MSTSVVKFSSHSSVCKIMTVDDFRRVLKRVDNSILVEKEVFSTSAVYVDYTKTASNEQTVIFNAVLKFLKYVNLLVITMSFDEPFTL